MQRFSISIGAILLLALTMTIPFADAAFGQEAAAKTKKANTNGKMAIRLVYSENFADLCSARDSKDLYDVVTAVLPSSHRVRRQLRSLATDENDCSAECAWIGAGKCSVMKPWLAGPCNDWHNDDRRRRLDDTSFLDFLQFQDSVMAQQEQQGLHIIPVLSTSKRCTEAVTAVREVLPHVKAVVTPGCQAIFQRPIEVTCFEGY